MSTPINPEHEKWGSSCAGSRWFNSKPEFRFSQLSEGPGSTKQYVQHWACPISGCVGNMIRTGKSWMTSPPGCHHTCDKCGFTAALIGEAYPKMIIVPPMPVETIRIDLNININDETQKQDKPA